MSDEALRLLERAVKGRYGDNLWWHEARALLSNVDIPAAREAVLVDTRNSRDLLDAPCLFCGYNGPGYWQSGTHSGSCPWRETGGADNRDIRAALADTSPAAAALLADARFWSRVRELIGPISGELDEEVFACLVGMVARWKDARTALAPGEPVSGEEKE